MKNLFASFLLLFAMSATAQSLKKPFKALNEGQLVEAATGFEEYKLKDSLDPLLWFGFARLYSEPAYVRCDFFLAWKCILRSQQLLAALDEKGLKKLEGELNADSLNRWQKHIDDRLFEKVSAENTVAMYEKHLQLCSASTHNKEVIQQRNARAFLDAKELNTVEAFKTFMRLFPDASETKDALVLRNAAAFADAARINTVESYQSFLDSFPQAAEFMKAFNARNELMLQEAIEIGTEEAYVDFMMNMAMSDLPEHPVDKSLYDRMNLASRQSRAGEHWIYYLSGGNIYRMNEKDMKTEEVIHDGKIGWFVINSNGEMVFVKETQPELLTFFLYAGGKTEKLCDFSKKGRFTNFDPDVPTFNASKDLNHLYFEYGMMVEAGYSYGASWSRGNTKWTCCELFDQECAFDFPFEKLLVKNNYVTASSSQENAFYTVKLNGVWELFRKDGNRDVQISHTDEFKVRETWGEEVDYMGYSESPTKVFYYFPQECGDFCYGPCFVANLDGSQQVLIDNSIWVGQVDVQWLYVSGDLLWIDESGNLIVYEGKENTIRLIASSVDQFRTVHIENSGE